MQHRGETLTSDEAAEVRALAERIGEREARKRLRVSPQTLARAIAQMHVQRGTLSLIRSALGHDVTRE